jgi:hypothetical protein
VTGRGFSESVIEEAALAWLEAIGSRCGLFLRSEGKAVLRLNPEQLKTRRSAKLGRYRRWEMSGEGMKRQPRFLHAAAALLLLGLSACAKSHVNDPQWKPFIESARGAYCADVRNRLFLIDDAMVLWDRAGRCADNGYQQVLYGRTPGEVLCSSSDSIAGPMKRCEAPSYAEIFEVMIAHLDTPGLGLGPEHKVERLPL